MSSASLSFAPFVTAAEPPVARISTSAPAAFIRWPRPQPRPRGISSSAYVVVLPQLMFRSMAVLILNCVAGGPRPVPELENQEIPAEEEEKEDSSSTSSSSSEDETSDEEEEKEEELAEELQSLEEAVMSDGDEGKAPDDYDRRAQIFDQSSKVFQALKERAEDPRSDE